MLWFGMAWNKLVWSGMIWHGLVLFGQYCEAEFKTMNDSRQRLCNYQGRYRAARAAKKATFAKGVDEA